MTTATIEIDKAESALLSELIEKAVVGPKDARVLADLYDKIKDTQKFYDKGNGHAHEPAPRRKL